MRTLLAIYGRLHFILRLPCQNLEVSFRLQTEEGGTKRKKKRKKLKNQKNKKRNGKEKKKGER